MWLHRLDIDRKEIEVPFSPWVRRSACYDSPLSHYKVTKFPAINELHIDPMCIMHDLA